jgi:hypothetical protein
MTSSPYNGRTRLELLDGQIQLLRDVVGFHGQPGLAGSGYSRQLTHSHKGRKKMYDTYEAACGATLTAAQTYHAIVHDHEASWGEFIAENGAQDHYDGLAVLDFLGY